MCYTINKITVIRIFNKSWQMNPEFLYPECLYPGYNSISQFIDFSINLLSTSGWLAWRCQHHNGTPTPYKIKVNNSKLIDFGDKNWVILTTFNCMILKFSEKFDNPFSHVFIFGNMFPESHGFDAVPVARSNNFDSLH